MNENINNSGCLVFNIYYVGDGDSTLIEFPSGKRVGIIDSNITSWRKSPPVLEALTEKIDILGECEIVFLCVSHPHLDHVTGLSEVLKIERAKIKEVWHTLPDIEEFLSMNACGGDTSIDQAWTKAAEIYYENQIGEFIRFTKASRDTVGIENMRTVRGIQCLPEIDGVKIYCLNPCHETMAIYKSAIDRAGGRFDKVGRELLDIISVTLLFVFGENTFLYSSDMQKNQWISLVNSIGGLKDMRRYLPVTVMKASHHGGTRSFYPNLWNDLVSKNSSYIIASGGSARHPSGAFRDSVIKTKRRLLCTGLGPACGRGNLKATEKDYYASKWLDRYSERIKDQYEACYGDIRITMPRQGSPTIEPIYDYKHCEIMLGEQV